MASPASPQRELEFFNGLGGFTDDGREYVTILGEGQWTPAPWINVIANPSFGFQTSVEGGGYTWAVNSQQNQLTPWSNDPVSDRPGEVIYVRDEDDGDAVDADRAADPRGNRTVHRHPRPGVQPVRTHRTWTLARAAAVRATGRSDQDFPADDQEPVGADRGICRSPRTWSGCSARHAPHVRRSWSPRSIRRLDAMLARNHWRTGSTRAWRSRISPGVNGHGRGTGRNSWAVTARSIIPSHSRRRHRSRIRWVAGSIPAARCKPDSIWRHTARPRSHFFSARPRRSDGSALARHAVPSGRSRRGLRAT